MSRNFITITEKKEIQKYRTVWQRLCAGETVTIAVDVPLDVDLDYGEIFKNYLETFIMYINRGTLKVKRLDEIKNEDFTILEGDEQ